jgi:hypothetical protein
MMHALTQGVAIGAMFLTMFVGIFLIGKLANVICCWVAKIGGSDRGSAGS